MKFKEEMKNLLRRKRKVMFFVIVFLHFIKEQPIIEAHVVTGMPVKN